MWKTIGYRIEAVPIKQLYHSQLVWFLDAVQVDAKGRESTSNICSGERDYCVETMNQLVAKSSKC